MVFIEPLIAVSDHEGISAVNGLDFKIMTKSHRCHVILPSGGIREIPATDKPDVWHVRVLEFVLELRSFYSSLVKVVVFAIKRIFLS